MRNFHLFALFGLCLGLSACSAVPPRAPDRDSLRPARIDSSSSSSSGFVMNREALTTETLTLGLAIETAFLNNPSLRADFAAFQAAAQEVPQASSLADPRISYTQFIQGVQTRTGEQQFAAGVSQMVPWFGKLRLQGLVARSGALQVLQDYRSQMLDVRERVERAWYGLAYEQAALVLAEEDKRTIEQILEAASALYESGQRGRGTLLQSQTELARIENQLAGYPARITEYREELARLLFLEDIGKVPSLDNVVPSEARLPESEILIAEAIDIRPEIERFRLGEEQAELRHRLARREYFPDFTFGLNYVGIGDRPDDPTGPMDPADEGEDAWGASVGINIPLPNAKRRAARIQAIRQREEAELRRIAAESEIEKEVRSLLPRLKSLDEQLGILQSNLLPLAEEAYNTNESAYRSGRATFLDLLNAQRTLIAVRRDLLVTRRDYLFTIAELERVVGGSLSTEELP